MRYTVGVMCKDTDEYERLIRSHSKSGIFELSFRKVCENKFFGRDEYPCLAVAAVDGNSPFGVLYSDKLSKIVDDGFMLIINKD